MGNSVAFWNVSGVPKDIDSFIHSLAFSTPLPTQTPHNIVLVWRLHSNGESAVINEAVNVMTSPTYNPTSSYIALHIFHGKGRSIENEKNSLDCLTAAIRPALDALTPRGLKVPISFRTRSLNEKDDVAYDVYVWNGKQASSLIKATSIAKAYQLERALRTQDIAHVMKCLPYHPKGSVALQGNDEMKDENALRSTHHHLLKTLMIINSNGALVDDNNDISELFSDANNTDSLIEATKIKTEKQTKEKEKKEKRKSKDKPSLPLNRKPLPLQLGGSGSVGTGLGLKLNMNRLEESKAPVSDRVVKPANSRNLVAASTVEFQRVVETGTERDEAIPRSTRDRVRHFNRICSKVTDELFLGSDFVARDMNMLKDNGITHVLNCAGTVCNNYFPDVFQYKTLHLLDGKQEDVVCMFLDVMEFIDNALNNKGRVFIHCQQGISRSSTMLICYLMFKWKDPYQKVAELVKKVRDISSPNAGFVCQLLAWQKTLTTSPSRRPKELYVVLPHNLCAPDVFPLKKVDCVVSSLDPRCVFVLMLPTTLCLWTGAHPHPECVRYAELYIKRLQYFLEANNNMTRVMQGSESSEFLEALGTDSTAKITQNAEYDTRIALLNLFDDRKTANLVPIPPKLSENTQMFLFVCEWYHIPNPTQSSVDALLNPRAIIAVLAVKGLKAPHAYMWLGSQYDGINDQEVNNLGLQFLSRNNIFMTMNDYKIIVSRQNKEAPNFREALKSAIEN